MLNGHKDVFSKLVPQCPTMGCAHRLKRAVESRHARSLSADWHSLLSQLPYNALAPTQSRFAKCPGLNLQLPLDRADDQFHIA